MVAEGSRRDRLDALHRSPRQPDLIGVEIQVSARSDVVAVDLLHINKSLRDGLIDVGVLVVPSDVLAGYLPSRAPNVSDSQRMLDMFNAETIPLVFWGLEHDGPGAALKVRGRDEDLAG